MFQTTLSRPHVRNLNPRRAFRVVALLVSACLAGTADAQLRGGGGWTGPTAVPPPVGNRLMDGYYGNSICRWNVVPFQTIEDVTRIGVVAFHMNGIDRVEFAVEGGEWIVDRSPAINPRTGVYEYSVTIDPDDFTDGPVEVRAIAYPARAGHPRVLQGEISGDTTPQGVHSLVIHMNGNGTLREPKRFVSPIGDDELGDGSRQFPFRTIYRAAQHIAAQYGTADGGRILLEAGDYDWGPSSAPTPDTVNRWLVIEPAAGVERGQVRITDSGSGGIKTKLVHLRGVTVYRTRLIAAAALDPMIWVEDCVLTAGGRQRNIALVGINVWTGGVFLTDSVIKHVMFASTGAAMVRNCLIRDIGADALKNPRFVMNTEVMRINNEGVNAHPDTVQFYGSHFDNIIIFGFRAVEEIGAQGFFSRRAGPEGNGVFRDSAFVNYIVKSDDFAGQWQQSTEHVLFWHFSYLGSPFWIRDDSNAEENDFYTDLRDISIRNSVFDSFLYGVRSGPPRSQITDECHFVRFGEYGTNATSGDPGFEDQENLNFKPSLFSPLRHRVGEVIVELGLDGNGVIVYRAIGPLQPDSDGVGIAAVPVSYRFRRGTHRSGGLFDLMQSDNGRLVGRSETGSGAEDPFVQELQVDLLVAGATDPETVAVTLEAHITSPSGSVLLELYDWTAGQYRFVDLQQIGMFERARRSSNTPIAGFVRADGMMRLRIRVEVPSTFLGYGFDGLFDYVDVRVF